MNPGARPERTFTLDELAAFCGLPASVVRRWIEKDVAALYFSSLGAGLTLRDRLRFVKAYRGLPLRESLQRDRRFWAAVEGKARQLERKPCR